MKLSMSPRLILRQSVFATFGETIGDIPMYSMHKIKNRIFGLQGVSREMKDVMCRCLVEANNRYKEESENDWACLTSNNLIWALERFEKKTRIMINMIRKGQPKEMRTLVAEVIFEAHEKRAHDVAIFKNWFTDNAEELQYNMRDSIPWFVIKSLRESLSFWIATKINSFGEEIEGAILKIASKNNVSAENAEDAWKKMGGKIFT